MWGGGRGKWRGKWRGERRGERPARRRQDGRGGDGSSVNSVVSGGSGGSSSSSGGGSGSSGGGEAAEEELRAELHQLLWLALEGAATHEPNGTTVGRLAVAIDPESARPPLWAADDEAGAATTATTTSPTDNTYAAAGRARAVLREAAAEWLRRAMQAQPMQARHRLAWSIHLLRGPAVHMVETVPELARAIEIEQRASLIHATPSNPSLHKAEADSGSATAGQAQARAGTPAGAPLSSAHVVYLWSAAPALRQALLASPPIRSVLDTLMVPRDDGVGSTPCDVEPKPVALDNEMAASSGGEGAKGAAATSGTGVSDAAESQQRELAAARAASRGTRGAPTVAAVWLVEVAAAELALGRASPSGAKQAQLVVNEYGVPSLSLLHRAHSSE